MTSLFGRGGRDNPGGDFRKDTEPAPLDMRGDKQEIIEKMVRPDPAKTMGPSSNNPPRRSNSNYGGYSGNSSSNPSSRGRADTPNEFADMESTDALQDEETATLRKDAYRLSNIEKQFDIQHKNDFSNIAKVVMICFAVFVGFGFFAIIGVIIFTSYKAGSMTETGIVGSILQFITEMIRLALT